MATLNRKDLRTTTCAMQHRHFATIAAIIRDMRGAYFDGEKVDDAAVDDIAEHFASYLRGTNPNFDKARFLAACGVEG